MKKKMITKLRGKAGESIAETLVALLIAAVALTMLASMITSTLSMVKNSETKMDSYYVGAEALELFETPKGNATFTVSTSGSLASTSVTETKTEIPVYENKSFHIYAYGK